MNQIVSAFFRRTLEEFQFLVDRYGFGRPVKKTDGGIYRVLYEGETAAVEIGLEWREQYVYVELFRLVNGKLKENPIIITPESELTVINLEDLVGLRAPKMKLRVERFVRPLSIESVDYAVTHYARALHQLGADVLTGNFKVFAEVGAVVKARMVEYPILRKRTAANKESAVTKKEGLKSRLDTLANEMVSRGVLFEDAVAEFERYFILLVLRRTKGDLSKAADELHIHRATLLRRVEKYNKNQSRAHFSKSPAKPRRTRAAAGARAGAR